MWNVDGLKPDEMTNLGSIRLKEIDEGFEKALQDFDKGDLDLSMNLWTMIAGISGFDD